LKLLTSEKSNKKFPDEIRFSASAPEDSDSDSVADYDDFALNEIKDYHVQGDHEDIDNIYKPEEYDSSGCPIVPIAFSGMMGRLGNVMCVYSNFIAIQWKLGFKYFLPKYMNHHTAKDITKPYFQSIFKNVSFPTATWTNISLARNAMPNDVVLFNNSRTGYKEVSCNKHFLRETHLQPFITEQLACAYKNECVGKSCLHCKGSCLCTNLWVTEAGGANYLDLSFVGDVLQDVIKYHLQFNDDITDKAKNVINNVANMIEAEVNTMFVGVHVRRTDFNEYSKFSERTFE